MMKRYLNIICALACLAPCLGLCPSAQAKDAAGDALTDLLQRYAPQIQAAEASKKPVTAPIAKRGYVIQVASFPTEADAKDLVTTLTQQHLQAFYTVATVKQKIWYRVAVGSFDDRVNAELFLKQNSSTTALERGMILETGPHSPAPAYVAKTQD